MNRAVVLLSGGLDSAVCLWLAALELGGENVFPVTCDWGQLSSSAELKAAAALSLEAGTAQPVVVRFEFPFDTPLTSAGLAAGEGTSGAAALGRAPTFVPGRNLVMLAYAFAIAGEVDADSVYFGACAADASGYPDCRPEFIEAAEKAGNLALGTDGIKVVAPLIGKSKAEVVRMGEELGVPWELTFSCYAPEEDGHCGECESCVLRRSALKAAGLEDHPA